MIQKVSTIAFCIPAEEKAAKCRAASKQWLDVCGIIISEVSLHL
jgi:hypothetical protein